MKKYLLFLFFTLLQISAYAGAANCGIKSNVRISVDAKLHVSNKVQILSYEGLNLKNAIPANALSSSPITVSASNFNAFTDPGKSWLAFNTERSISMNIGSANSTTAQNWVLPSNFEDQFTGAERIDFIPISSIPVPLRIAGANKASLGYYYDEDDRIMKVYQHYNVGATKISNLGTSYDLVSGDDDVFDEPDFDVTNVPMALGDNYTVTIFEDDYITNLELFKFEQDISVDAFGSIETPEGTFSCLRINILTRSYQRQNESQPYSLTKTERTIGFFTREGLFFYGISPSASGTVTLSGLKYRIVVNTNELTDYSIIKLNNTGTGVTINNDDDDPHPSAILDIKSDSLGILIPRIAKANRPNAPATGLMVYQIDNTPGFYYFDGSNWKILSSSNSSFARIEATENKQQITVPKEVISGTARLSRGNTTVKVNSSKASILNLEKAIITLQPEGDCRGLYIKNKTKDGFEVKELRKGKSNANFSYIIN